MCRQNQFWGGMLIAFGLGVLVGIWLEGGFISCCFGAGVALLGLFALRR